MTSKPHSAHYSFLNSRLARKQLFYILVVSSLITLIGTIVQLLIEYRSERQYVGTQLDQIESSHLPSLTSSLWALDDRQLSIHLNNILSLRDIVYLEITEEGEIIAAAGSRKPKGAIIRSYPMIYNRDGTATEIGRLHAHASVQGVYRRMIRRIFVILVTQGLKTFFVSLFILFIIHRTVIQYLLKLSKYTQGLSLDRLDDEPYAGRTASNPPDELDRLIHAINDLRERLLQDITLQKKSEEVLRESEALFRTISDNIPHSYLLIIDRDMTIGFSSGREFKQQNFDPRRLAGQSVNRVFGPDAAFIKEQLLQTFDGEDAEFELYFNAQHLHWRVVPLGPSGQGIQRVLAVVENITERIEAEQGMSFFFDQSLVMLFIADIAQNQLLRVNKEAVRIIGRSEEELLSTPLIDIVHPDDRAITLAAIADLVKGDPLVGFQNRNVTADGDVRIFEWNAVVDPERQRLYAMAKDITERQTAEAEREKLQAQLLQAQKMESIGQLAGGVAHDFNNMLGIILGHSEMILEDLDPDHPLAARIHEIRDAADRSAYFTRQLLAFARKQPIAPIVLNLNETLEGMLNMLKRLIGEGIELEWLPGQDLWPVRLDPSQIDQVLANLCVNARDSINGVGNVIIETSNATLDEAYCIVHEGSRPGDYVVLTVSDNGCGIEKHNLGKLFEPFFTTKDIGQGTGLGLSTVYGIVKQNDGYINVYSEPGQGATFKIYLPRHREATRPRHAECELVEEHSSGGETILLVEDEASILLMARMMLERLGYNILCAARPGEALKIGASCSKKIHLLITDVVMPEMSGRDLAERMTALYPDLKCLYMSGYPANVIAHHGVLDDGVLFINKPFNLNTLSAMVRKALDQAQTTNGS